MTHKQQAEIRLRTNDLSIDFGSLKAMGKVYLMFLSGDQGTVLGSVPEAFFAAIAAELIRGWMSGQSCDTLL